MLRLPPTYVGVSDGTHVRRKKGKFWHIGVVFRFAVWYTRLNKSEFVEESNLLVLNKLERLLTVCFKPKEN